MRSVRRTLPLLLVPLGACSDLLDVAERVPTSVQIADSVLTVTRGARTQIAVTVLDQHGRPFDRLPAWAAPAWTTGDPATVGVEGQELVAAATGETWAEVSVGGLTARAVVRVNPAQLRMTVHALEVTQSIQPVASGWTPILVQGREAIARVYLMGDQRSFFEPEVRVKVYHGATLVRTLTDQALAVPTEFSPVSYATSWNVRIPGELVVPGMALLVEADPAGVVPLAAGSQTRHPASGVPLPMDVRAVPPLYLRLVPVRQSGSGTAGTIGSRAAFVDPLVRMFPVHEVDVDQRAVYTTSASTDDGAGWSTILREIAALRLADGSERYYYGVVSRTTTGITGIGYLGYPSALGWDQQPGAAQTLAHELGHNFGRYHAPCGMPAGVDPAFPTVNAWLDWHGLDVRTESVREPATYRDLMSYCDPEWITWYTYRAIMEYRDTYDWGLAPQSRAAEPVLLVWGTIRGDGEVELEPAFQIMAAPRLPDAPGAYRIEAQDAAGATLYAFSFDAPQVVDGPRGERHFAFTVPQRVLRMDRLAQVRLFAGARQARLRTGVAPAGGFQPVPPRFSVSRAGGDGVALSWSEEAHPVVMVRDPRTGQVLSFARGGAAQVQTDAPELELLFSDGVRTTPRRVQIR
ncbi:MAG TPA: hypothetical protein VFR37_07600 [Longimicrobium sp.]|nr:hypothetical protein [Longimicrobium sp.]